MAKVIVFGTSDFAQLADYYLKSDSEHEVVAFSLTREYMGQTSEFLSRPVVAFEDVERLYPPDAFSFFAPMSPTRMNRDRERIFVAAKEKGYGCISYVSSRATVLDNEIGENCFILEDNTLQPFTSIGDNVVLWSGNHIGHHGRIDDHVMFTSHVVMSGHCHIGRYSTLGVNATLRDGITIGEGSFIAMGAVVTQNTEPWTMYKGHPAVAGRSTKDL